MKDLLDKISSYNLFNYLFPGIIFVVLLEGLTKYSLIQQDIILAVFLYYFIGMVISRVGSLVIEPFLKKISFLHYVDYKDFVVISKSDEKIEILSEANNTYRTLCSMFLLLLILKLYEKIESFLPVFQNWQMTILIILLLILFLLSYKKQTKYITERIKANQ